eukprot:gene5850-6091_t
MILLGHAELVRRGRIQPTVPAQFPLEKFPEEYESMFEVRLDPTAVGCLSLRQLLAENFADYVSQHKIEGSRTRQ